MPGVFISEGTQLRISGLRIRIHEDGSVEVPPFQVEVSLDVWPFWLDVAMDHAASSIGARNQLAAAYQTASGGEVEGDLQAGLLGREFTNGMVAIAAAAFALDNFYLAILPLAPVGAATQEQWEAAKTARHRRISETLRRNFRIANRGAKQLHKSVQEIFRFRDWAVHPPAEFREPVKHDLVDAAVEWRFVAFSGSNAAKAAAAAASLIGQCIESPRAKNTNLVEWCEGRRERITPRWERARREFGTFLESLPPTESRQRS